MANASLPLSAQYAERLRRFEHQRHDSLAATYHDFFTPITALAIQPLLDAAGADVGSNLLDIATGPGLVAAKARRLGAASIGRKSVLRDSLATTKRSPAQLRSALIDFSKE